MMDAESERLAVLHQYAILDTPPEDRFDRLTRLSSDLLGTPIALVSLVDRDRQWFKSHLGLVAHETPRAWSFCNHLVKAGPGAELVVPDATQDDRFADNPLVTGDPHIRFYAGVALTTESGHNCGSLCVIDTVPRPPPTEAEMRLLRAFSAIVVDEMELGRRSRLNDEREAMLALAGAMSGVGHWHLDATTERLTWSPEVFHIFGVSPADYTPDLASALAFYAPQDRAVIQNLLTLARIGGQGFSFRLRVNRADGALRDVECKAECRLNAAGRVSALIGVLHDITETVQATRKLQETASKFRLLAEHARDMVSHVGLDGRKHYVSSASKHIFGFAPEEMVDKNILHLIHPDDAPPVAKLQIGLLTGRIEQGTVSFRVERPGGQHAWIESSAQALRDPLTGELDGYISVMRDISDRHAVMDALVAREEELEHANTRLERLAYHLSQARDHAEQSSEAKSRFLTAMSHELRTPLNGILGYAQLLQMDGSLDASQTQRVGAMLGAGEHLLAMINNVLDLAEIEKSQLAVRSDVVDLSQLLRTCLDVVRPTAQNKGLAVSSTLEPGTPARVLLDQTRLQQVLLNLLGNAVKYTLKGSVDLRLRTDAQTGLLRFEVADTGPGIPADRRDELFGEFERLGAGDTGTVEGIGLGLSICAKVATLQGGRIGWAENPGGGSIFWLELPLVPAADAPTAPAALATEAPDLSFAGAHILVVDDVEMNRDIAGAFLRSAGYTVAFAEGGAEAVAVAAAQPFDLMVVDVRMPGIDGLEATRRIRALPGTNARTPIIALTAQSFAGQIQACQAAGMNAHLAKPYTRQALLDAVACALRDGVAGTAPAPAADAVAEAEGPAPIMDLAAFERTAAYLEPTALNGHVKSLVARSEDLLNSLCEPAGDTSDLVFAAHILAGSAGMFGFERLSLSARHYERAMENDLPEKGSAISDLVAAIEISLADMRQRLCDAPA